jgi:hypothetical protein
MNAAGADASRVLVERVQTAAAAVFMTGDGGSQGAAAAAAAGGLKFPELRQGVAQERRDAVRRGVLLVHSYCCLSFAAAAAAIHCLLLPFAATLGGAAA